MRCTSPHCRGTLIAFAVIREAIRPSSGACLLRSESDNRTITLASGVHLTNPPLSAEIVAKVTDDQKFSRIPEEPHFKGTPVET
jgi:hypothetical protein